MKLYLNIQVTSRQELISKFGYQFQITCPRCNNIAIYNTTEVCAEIDQNQVPAFALIGGLIGALGGPEGAIIGGILGAGLGAAQAEEERKKVIRFNAWV